jgi:uncharacterized protein YbjT (DUF2867 family)
VAGLVLLTGATGYVGGRLLEALLRDGRRVRCLVRDAGRLDPAASVQVVEGDVRDPEALARALDGVDVAYYLVHSLAGDDFEQADRAAAESFAAAAARAGVRRMVYLGGLGRGTLSAHLRSRQEVGRVLRASGVETLELRASIVVGAGSLSFELVRNLVDRLPIMITPRWVETAAQPIAIDDVVAYLAACVDVDVDVDGSAVFEVGGRDRATYGELMREYARQRGVRRLMIAVPVLSPGLSGLWLRLVTPVHAAVGRRLVDSLRNATVVEDRSADAVFDVRPVGIAEAVARALVEPRPVVRRRLVDARSTAVRVSPEAAFEPVRRIGGRTGWYYGDALWRLRGALDRALGGVGLRRGRRDPRELIAGEPLDFWRVAEFDPPRRLRLEAEMRLPGRAWLEFQVEPAPGGAALRQTAVFEPRGLAGYAYWYGLYALHQLVFRGMLRGLAQAAETQDQQPVIRRPADGVEAVDGGLASP